MVQPLVVHVRSQPPTQAPDFGLGSLGVGHLSHFYTKLDPLAVCKPPGLVHEVQSEWAWGMGDRNQPGPNRVQHAPMSPCTPSLPIRRGSKSLWLGLYFAAIPLGQAIGIWCGCGKGRWGPGM